MSVIQAGDQVSLPAEDRRVGLSPSHQMAAYTQDPDQKSPSQQNHHRMGLRRMLLGRMTDERCNRCDGKASDPGQKNETHTNELEKNEGIAILVIATV